MTVDSATLLKQFIILLGLHGEDLEETCFTMQPFLRNKYITLKQKNLPKMNVNVYNLYVLIFKIIIGWQQSP